MKEKKKVKPAYQRFRHLVKKQGVVVQEDLVGNKENQQPSAEVVSSVEEEIAASQETLEPIREDPGKKESLGVDQPKPLVEEEKEKVEEELHNPYESTRQASFNLL